MKHEWNMQGFESFVFLIGKFLHYSWNNTNFAKIFAK